MRGTNDKALTGKILVFLDKCSPMGGSPSFTKGDRTWRFDCMGIRNF